MANGSFKTLGGNDIVSTRTLLHEAIPLTGTIVSGTYSDNNIKKHSHGMFESVYDYPFLSSSANLNNFLRLLEAMICLFLYSRDVILLNEYKSSVCSSKSVNSFCKSLSRF